MNRAWVSLLISGLFVCGCEKEKTSGENIFYGTWVKGSNYGDTLRFYKNNGKNILAYNGSFNTALPAPIETEFIYRQGKLSLKYYGSSIAIILWTLLNGSGWVKNSRCRE